MRAPRRAMFRASPYSSTKKSMQPTHPTRKTTRQCLRATVSAVLRSGPLFVAWALALGLACTAGGSVNQCRSERDQAALCGIALLEYTVACTTLNSGNDSAARSCLLPAAGSLLVCPLLVSEECSN